jgi:TPR repeat protein
VTKDRKAAKQGDADAQQFLGVSYYKGKAVAEAKARTVKWYRKAEKSRQRRRTLFPWYMPPGRGGYG